MKWFIGQRVKLVRPCNPVNMGIEGNISLLLPYEVPEGTPCIGGFLSQTANCAVVWDMHRAIGDMSGSAQHTDQLEPLLPDGMKPASWEDTVWDPSRLIEESKELVCIA